MSKNLGLKIGNAKNQYPLEHRLTVKINTNKGTLYIHIKRERVRERERERKDIQDLIYIMTLMRLVIAKSKQKYIRHKSSIFSVQAFISPLNLIVT